MSLEESALIDAEKPRMDDVKVDIEMEIFTIYKNISTQTCKRSQRYSPPTADNLSKKVRLKPLKSVGSLQQQPSLTTRSVDHSGKYYYKLFLTLCF